jgi:hypothetical protein
MTTGAMWGSTGDLWARSEALVDQILESRRLDPDFNPRQDEDEKSLKDLIRQTLRASVEIQGGYHEGGAGDPVLKWILGILATLVASSVIGGVLMFGRLSALEAKVDGLQKIVGSRYHE